jgi:esterase/lipase superfamily enzyme
MEKWVSSWYSHRLQKEMPVAVYGHYGFALLLVPTAAADYLEYERFQLINAVNYLVDSGKLKIFSINSINNESWMNDQIEPRTKIIRHQQFNEYVYEEVIPFIKTHTSSDTSIIICGASFGALHSMNLFLKRPDLLNGVIAMSGVYYITEKNKG